MRVVSKLLGSFWNEVKQKEKKGLKNVMQNKNG